MNRGTIYYHFPTKESMRLEAQWGYFIDCKRVAEKYCQDERYVSIVAMALYNIKMQRDVKLARFCRQSCVDYPVFTGKKDLTYFYCSAYEYMWSRFWDMEKISPMAFATVYGYIMSCVRLLCEHPNQYEALELFLHCCQASLSIWGAPNSLAQETNARIYITALPDEAYTVQSCV